MHDCSTFVEKSEDTVVWYAMHTLIICAILTHRHGSHLLRRVMTATSAPHEMLRPAAAAASNGRNAVYIYIHLYSSKW